MAGTQQFRNALVLGASGKLGRMVRALWHPAALNVVPVFRSMPHSHGALEWSPGDVWPCVDQVSAIIALWGVTPGPDRDLSANSRLAVAAIELGETLGADVVLHCSSAAVYCPTPYPLGETVSPQPISPYGQAKLEMEGAIEAYKLQANARQIVMRIGNVAGADSLFANLAAGSGITLDRFADGRGPSRSYLSPVDLVRVIDTLVRDESCEGVFNVSAPVPTPMAHIAQACDVSVNWRDAPSTAAQQVWLDTDRLGGIIKLSEDTSRPEYLISGARASEVWG